MDDLVSTDWLAGKLGSRDLRIVDATIFLPGSGRDARAEYEAEHIPGAVFLDLDEVVDASKTIPHMLPPEHKLASRVQALGIGDGDRIVVYDNSPLHSSARAWWMLRTFGAHRVALLDGGLAKWKAEGLPLEQRAPAVRTGHFTPRFVAEAVVDLEQVGRIHRQNTHEILDARSAGRFFGEEAEPRAGVLPGHIPGSKNLPQGQLFNDDNSWKRGEALRAEFQAAGVDMSKPMVTTCGSGVTAAVLLFGARLLGKEDVQLYDGSWSEWGSDPATPKASGRG